MKCKLTTTLECTPNAPDDPEQQVTEGSKRFWRVGAVLEHPQSFLLVHGGFAEAADDECRDRVAEMNQTQRGVLKSVHDRIMKEQEEFQQDLEAEELDEVDEE